MTLVFFPVVILHVVDLFLISSLQNSCSQRNDDVVVVDVYKRRYVRFWFKLKHRITVLCV